MLNDHAYPGRGGERCVAVWTRRFDGSAEPPGPDYSGATPRDHSRSHRRTSAVWE